MEDILIGFGILLATLGPLLLLPVIWIIYRLVTKKFVDWSCRDKFNQKIKNLLAVTASTVVVFFILLISYLPGKLQYDRLCVNHGNPSIQDRVNTNSFYRTRLYPYEARKFIEQNGFIFVEAPHMYKEDRYVKYTIADDGSVLEEEIPEPISQYGIREETSMLPSGITLTRKIAYEISTGNEFANAASIMYDGGPLSLFLGVYAMEHCPDILTTAGSKNFQTFYNFEKIVLTADQM